MCRTSRDLQKPELLPNSFWLDDSPRSFYRNIFQFIFVTPLVYYLPLLFLYFLYSDGVPKSKATMSHEEHTSLLKKWCIRESFQNYCGLIRMTSKRIYAAFTFFICLLLGYFLLSYFSLKAPETRLPQNSGYD